MWEQQVFMLSLIIGSKLEWWQINLYMNGVFTYRCYCSVWSTDVDAWQNKLGCLVSGWVTVFSLNDISRLRRPKNVKFGTKLASSMRMMYALRFLENFNCGKICQKNAKNRHKNRQTVKNASFFSTCMVVPHICRNSIYMAPLWEWIIHILP